MRPPEFRRPGAAIPRSFAKNRRSPDCVVHNHSHRNPGTVQSDARVDLLRRTTNGPIASRSTGAEPKHSRASRGSSTIGRPAVFREVLTTTGTPVRAAKASSIRATRGSGRGGGGGAGVDGLHARGAVDVHDRGDALAPGVVDVVDEEHVRRGLAAAEDGRR